mgnify:CR=1 FL=1
MIPCKILIRFLGIKSCGNVNRQQLRLEYMFLRYLNVLAQLVTLSAASLPQGVTADSPISKDQFSSVAGHSQCHKTIKSCHQNLLQFSTKKPQWRRPIKKILYTNPTHLSLPTLGNVTVRSEAFPDGTETFSWTVHDMPYNQLFHFFNDFYNFFSTSGISSVSQYPISWGQP